MGTISSDETDGGGAVGHARENQVPGGDAILAQLGRDAQAFRFRVAPNPCVGAAVLFEGEVVARGFHEEWGAPHAEVMAIEAARAAGIDLPRCILAVTMEPCSSSGKTPPCVDAIFASGIPSAIVGSIDPDPRHRGKGLEAMTLAGMAVEPMPGASPIERVSPHFLTWMHPDRLRRPLPWVIAKWAQTRSGQLSPPADVGDGRWITGPDVTAAVHRLRSNVDAVVTGVGTVLADDPRLDARIPGASCAQPLRVILDPDLRTPPDARLFDAGSETGVGAGQVHIICRSGAGPARHRALERSGARCHGLPAADAGRPSIRSMLGVMWELGVRRLMLEAGPTLLDAFLEQDFVDQLQVYTGDVRGGRGPTLEKHLALERWRATTHGECGEDAVLEAFRS